jgi:ribosome-associated toxin RatA of RatAB toxin-antitoxin module
MNKNCDHNIDPTQVIGFPPIFGESYRSHVSLFRPNLVTAVSTDMKLFRHLKSVWKFQEPIL